MARRPICAPLRPPASAWPAIQVIAGSNTDAVVELTAAAHLRLYPMLGIPRSQGAAVDAGTMAAFVTSFAQRYGRGGTFWAQHPGAPLPAGGELRDRQRARHHPDRARRSDLASLRGPGGVRAGVRGGAHRASPGRPSRAGGRRRDARLGWDRARSGRAVPGRDRPDGCGGLPPLPLQRDDHGAGHAGAACLARCAWGCRRPARHQRVRSAGRRLRLGRAGRAVHPVGALHAGAARRGRPGLLVGCDPDGRRRPLVLHGEQRALGDVAGIRLPERGHGPDLAGMSGAGDSGHDGASARPRHQGPRTTQARQAASQEEEAAQPPTSAASPRTSATRRASRPASTARSHGRTAAYELSAVEVAERIPGREASRYRAGPCPRLPQPRPRLAFTRSPRPETPGWASTSRRFPPPAARSRPTACIRWRERSAGRAAPAGPAARERGGTGNAGGSASSPGGGAISSSTAHALAQHGPTGAAAASLAQATAPPRSPSPAHRNEAGASASNGEGSSPASSVLKSLTGATGGGGLGPLLPSLLIASVLGAAVLALLRRRRTS